MSTAQKKVILGSFIFCAAVSPLFALAETVSGGFPSGSLWLSKTSVTEGESVQIFAPIYNAGAEKLSGDVAFLVDESPIGTVHFTLGAGESQIASMSWSAKQGAHAVSAKIENTLGEVSKADVALSKEETGSIDVTVAPPPPQPAIVKILTGAGNAVSTAVAASLPAVSSTLSAVLGETESIRTQAKDALEKNLASAAPSSEGQVLGTEIERPSGTALAASAASAVPSFSPLRIITEVALFIVSYAWVFYPLLLVVLLIVFYIVAKQIARPRKTA